MMTTDGTIAAGRTHTGAAIRNQERVREDRMKLFTAWISGRQLETAMDLPGWSHKVEERAETSAQGNRRIKIAFTAPNRRQAIKDCRRICLNARDLNDGIPFRHNIKKGA
jgi:hypothetical protein